MKKLLGKNVKPEPRDKKTSIRLSCSGILATKKQKRVTNEFERQVFAYFCLNKQQLGITKVYKLKNTMVDGLIELSDGTVVLVEVKYALNWCNCCIARHEIQRCIAEMDCQISNALIVFENFSADWDNTQTGHVLKNGWNRFYEEENILRKVVPVTVAIAQLTKQGLYNPYDK